MPAVMNKPRDGVLTANGLSADFRFIRAASDGGPWSLVETAIGEGFVRDCKLTYDPPRDLSPEAAAAVAKDVIEP